MLLDYNLMVDKEGQKTEKVKFSVFVHFFIKFTEEYDIFLLKLFSIF